MNIGASPLSKPTDAYSLDYCLLLTFATALGGLAAPSESAPNPTVSAEAAAAGKDVVHQLNNAFAHVFEVVAPSVVIIEVSKKNEITDSSIFDDLFFQAPPG